MVSDPSRAGRVLQSFRRQAVVTGGIRLVVDVVDTRLRGENVLRVYGIASMLEVQDVMTRPSLVGFFPGCAWLPIRAVLRKASGMIDWNQIFHSEDGF
jgi:hypothetical protein